MGILETAILYGIIGCVVAAGMGLAHGKWRWVGLWAVFWPLFAPLLLARGSDAAGEHQGFEHRIRDGEGRLLAALASLEGIAEEVLAPEVARVEHLGRALVELGRRIGEMDVLLASPEFDLAAVERALTDLDTRGLGPDDPRRQSLHARRRNIERLGGLRRRADDDLERALLKVEEMSSQLRLLRFTAHPEQEVVRQVRDIAASVEAVTEGLLDTQSMR